ncbi:tetratricopeptide repeat protein [Pseudomonas aeruginosa]|nr:tetratricopeptide repeat protein [Pseudomonas aeruginosa]MBS8174149.1 tetratricopeptide repeat protein [Pseudomonas aeruginosa]
MIEGLEKMLAKGVDNALLRFGLGKGYLDAGDAERAAEHLQRCVEQDPKYSAGWKLLGKARQAAGDLAGARQAWEQGQATAATHGDKQAEKEMTVFRQGENLSVRPRLAQRVLATRRPEFRQTGRACSSSAGRTVRARPDDTFTKTCSTHS